jgi:CBS-domain-containing membrane protein
VLWPALGALVGLALVGVLSDFVRQPLIMAPFGATAALAFGLPESPLAQPRNVVGGHTVSTAVGLAIVALGAGGTIAIAIGAAAALAAMLATGTLHAPAGATALLVITQDPGPIFLLTPVLLGSIALVAVAVVFNNLPHDRRYPTYWR